MSVEEKEFTLKKAYAYLTTNGVNWSFGWFKTQVNLGKISSLKVFNSRIVERTTLEGIVKEWREKEFTHGGPNG